MPYLVPAIANTMRILDYLKDEGHTRASLSEIARATDIPTSTCQNTLRTLVHFGLLSFDNLTKRYSLGLTLLELGTRAADITSHSEILRPYLLALAKRTGITCVLWRLVGDQLMSIEKVEGSENVRATTTVGQSHPLWSGAPGKAILAYWPEEEVRAYARTHRLPQFTEYSITEIDELVGVLREVRRSGFATSAEEYYRGISAVASPIFEAGDRPTLVVGSIGLATALVPARMNELGGLVSDEAKQMTAALGGRWADVG